MAFTTITVSNGVELKKVPLGFSWTTFFFGGFPALFRQDWLVGILVIIGCMFTWGFVGIVMSFIYNKMYAKALFNKGYWIHAMPPGVTEDTVKMNLGLLSLPQAK